jgi:hypothetical protein
VSALHAVRVAARIRRELHAEVEMVHGHYGEFKVLVDGEVVSDGGALTFLGIMPSASEVIARVRERLEEPGATAG